MAGEILRVLEALRHALSGWGYMVRKEPNIRYLLVVLILTPFTALADLVTTGEMALLLLAIVMTTGLEILNTAVEDTLDLVIPRYHPVVKRVKDTMSSAVLLGVLLYILLFCLAVAT